MRSIDEISNALYEDLTYHDHQPTEVGLIKAALKLAIDAEREACIQDALNLGDYYTADAIRARGAK
jgi:hypothetical protein